jgi:hypothetical protein
LQPPSATKRQRAGRSRLEARFALQFFCLRMIFSENRCTLFRIMR